MLITLIYIVGERRTYFDVAARHTGPDFDVAERHTGRGNGRGSRGEGVRAGGCGGVPRAHRDI